MTAKAQPYMSEALYLEQERQSSVKHEYYAGVIYAMVGNSEQHNLIAMNVAASLHTQLRGRPCRAYPSDMRLKVMQSGLNTYPDFTIVCGASQFTDFDKRDTLVNPCVIIEILSPPTEWYDRGLKFQHYRTIDTLQEYILISQDKHRIECFTRQAANDWLFSEAVGRETSLHIPALGVTLALADVYEQVVVAPDPFLRPLAD